MTRLLTKAQLRLAKQVAKADKDGFSFPVDRLRRKAVEELIRQELVVAYQGEYYIWLRAQLKLIGKAVHNGWLNS